MDRLSRLLAPLVVFATSLVAVVACYGPTEVTVRVSTDLGCALPLRTAIYKGNAGKFENEQETETSSCTPLEGSSEAEIGTLVFVPSGDREGSVSVKAVLARGKAPDTCGREDPDCVVATRSFRFIAHASRRVPIRLLKECLGKFCAEGTTCVAGGRCVSDVCPNNDCEQAIDGGTEAGPADASPDAPILTSCESKVPTPIASSSKLPNAGAASPSAFYWAAPSKDGLHDIAVWKLTKSTGEASEIAAFGMPGDLVPHEIPGIGVSGEDPLFAHGSLNTFVATVGGADYPFEGVPNAITGVGPTVMIATPSKILSADTNMKGATFGVVAIFGARSLTVEGGNAVLAGAGEGIFRAVPPGTFTNKALTASPGDALLARNATGQVYAAGVVPPSLSAHQVVQVGANEVKNLGVVGVAAPTAIAADTAFVYVAVGRQVLRYSTSPGAVPGPSELVFSASVTEIRHLSVDDGCLHYWGADASGASLYRRSKLPD